MRAGKYQSTKKTEDSNAPPETARLSKMSKLDMRGGSPQPIKSARVSNIAPMTRQGARP